MFGPILFFGALYAAYRYWPRKQATTVVGAPYKRRGHHVRPASTLEVTSSPSLVRVSLIGNPASIIIQSPLSVAVTGPWKSKNVTSPQISNAINYDAPTKVTVVASDGSVQVYQQIYYLTISNDGTPIAPVT